MKKLPEFTNEQELIDWFDTYDTAEFLEEAEEAAEKFEVVRTLFATKSVDVRLRLDYLTAIQELANRKGIPYQRLVQTWLVEKLSQEAPDLMPQ